MSHKTEETLQALKTGNPVYTFETKIITNASISPTGELIIDFVFGETKQGQAAVIRLLAAPEATKILWELLAKSRNILDALPSAQSSQSAN